MWEGNPGYQLDVAIAMHEYVCVCMCVCWLLVTLSTVQRAATTPKRSWTQSQCRGYAYRRTLPRQRRQRSRRSRAQGQLIGQEVQPATTSSSSVQRERAAGAFVWAAIERQSRFQNGRQTGDLEHSPFIGCCSQGQTAEQQKQYRGEGESCTGGEEEGGARVNLHGQGQDTNRMSTDPNISQDGNAIKQPKKLH